METLLPILLDQDPIYLVVIPLAWVAWQQNKRVGEVQDMRISDQQSHQDKTDALLNSISLQMERQADALRALADEVRK